MPQRPNFSSLNISSQLIGISQEVEHDFLQKRTLGENSDKWELRKRRNLPHLHCLCSLRRIFILLYLGSKLDQPAPTKKENPEVFQMPAEYTSLADSDLACSHRHGADPDVQLGSARSLHRGFRWVQSKCKRLCTFPVPVHTSCVHRGRTAWCGRNCCFSCTWQTLRKGKKWLEERFAYRGQYGAQQWGPCTKQLIVLWGGTRARRRFRTDLIFVGRECWRCSSMPTNCDWKLGQETVFVCVCVCVCGGGVWEGAWSIDARILFPHMLFWKGSFDAHQMMPTNYARDTNEHIVIFAIDIFCRCHQKLHDATCLPYFHMKTRLQSESYSLAVSNQMITSSQNWSEMVCKWAMDWHLLKTTPNNPHIGATHDGFPCSPKWA